MDKEMFRAPEVKQGKHMVETGTEVFGEVKREKSNVKREIHKTALELRSAQNIKIKELNPAGKARIWNVYDKKDALIGVIRFYKERNRYVFEPEGWQVFDSDMMEDISLVMRDEKLAEREMSKVKRETGK